jgi:hypothetical protein
MDITQIVTIEHLQPLLRRMSEMETELKIMKGVKPHYYTFAETQKLLGVNNQLLSRTTVQRYIDNDVLRAKQDGFKHSVYVLASDVHEMQKVLLNTKYHRTPFHFVRNWE